MDTKKYNSARIKRVLNASVRSITSVVLSCSQHYLNDWVFDTIELLASVSYLDPCLTFRCQNEMLVVIRIKLEFKWGLHKSRYIYMMLGVVGTLQIVCTYTKNVWHQRVKVKAWRIAILTEVFCGFHQSHHANPG
jgi:hypothetical protein